MAEKAQVGDLIRVVDAKPYEGEEYENGDIYEVLGRFGDGDVGVYVNKKDYFGDDLRLYDREYVIHRKAGEEDEKPKHYCDACRKELGELCCTSSFGGSFCSAKCADDYAEYKQALADRNDEIKANKTQADHIRKAGKELTELLVRKNHDYGDSFAKQYEKYGLMSALIRMDDKMRRLETLLGGTDAQVDESIKDSLLDLAGYALLASIEAGKR